jgi:hypothetical protein
MRKPAAHTMRRHVYSPLGTVGREAHSPLGCSTSIWGTLDWKHICVVCSTVDLFSNGHTQRPYRVTGEAELVLGGVVWRAELRGKDKRWQSAHRISEHVAL